MCPLSSGNRFFSPRCRWNFSCELLACICSLPFIFFLLSSHWTMVNYWIRNGDLWRRSNGGHKQCVKHTWSRTWRPPVEFGKTQNGAKCIFGNREQVIIPPDAVSCLVHAAWWTFRKGNSLFRRPRVHPAEWECRFRLISGEHPLYLSRTDSRSVRQYL